MSDPTVFETWRMTVGIDERLQSADPHRIEAARDLLAELAGIHDEDQLRHRLAFGTNEEQEHLRNRDAQEEVRRGNDDLALWILSEAVRLPEPAVSPQDRLNWVEWLLFVCKYGKEHQLFGAHGKALQGILLQQHAQSREAGRALEEAAQDYRELPGDDWRGPESVCLFCLGVLAGDAGDFAGGTEWLERARESAKQACRTGPAWIARIESEMQALAAQKLLVHDLARVSSPARLREAAAAHPGSAGNRTLNILRALALEAGAQKRGKDALALASAADWLAPAVGGHIQCRADLAELALYMNEYDLAETLLSALLEESPDNLDYRGKMGRSLFHQGRNAEAIEHLTEVLERSPGDAAALRDLGGVYVNLGDFGAARRYLQAANAADPSDPLPATLLEQLGDRGSEPLVAFDPVSKQIQISEALLSHPSEEVGMMITAALLQADPPSASAILQSIAQEKGIEYARRVAEMAFPLSQDAQPSHYDKGEDLFASRRIPEALEEYKLAIAENRDHAPSYMGAGDCFYHMGKFNLAAAFFEESVAIKPSPSTLRFLGDAHRKAGRYQGAVLAYEQAVELDPSYRPAREQLLALKKQMGESDHA